MTTGIPITLKRACEAIEIPSGLRTTLPPGTIVRIMQSLGTSYTVNSDYGPMYRIEASNADALGLSNADSATPAGEQRPFSEKLVWDEMKTIFDPEIPVNIVDLGLIYSCAIAPAEQGGHKIDIKMSMTAPGCGMGGILKADVESKLGRLADVKQVDVEIVFEPAWSPKLMSEAAKLQLGFDLDVGDPSSDFPVIR